MENKKYYVGLDIGTNSVGYAVTDTSENYNLIKFKGEPMWGVHLFEEAQLAEERRGFRSARRRLDRRQQRIKLLQELFAKEISKKDINFFKRISESALLKTDREDPFCIFNDPGFNDKDFNKKYPTIHHLIVELIENPEPHDVRLVYIACAWIMAHRGHFLSDVSDENVDSLLNFREIYKKMMDFFASVSGDDYVVPWNVEEEKIDELGEKIKTSNGLSRKYSALCNFLFAGKKPKKNIETGFPYSVEGILKLISGSKYKVSELFDKEEYSELGSVALSDEDEALDNVMRAIGDDFDLIVVLKEVYDWSVLADLLHGYQYISQSKIEIYNQHRADLKELKRFVRKEKNDKYNEIFNEVVNGNYLTYSGNERSLSEEEISKIGKRTVPSQEVFCDFIKKTLNLSDETVKLGKMSQETYDRICNKTFMPKQVNGDNRVIPYQVYFVELKRILDNAGKYLPFLNEIDETGYETKNKILSIMKFRIPYYVGPLNKYKNEQAWLVRKAEGKIYPWNFDKMIDADLSENAFINNMTNSCTYLAKEDVLPKHSLIYEKFEVLNEINNIKINGIKISVDAKQKLYEELFLRKKKVSVKQIKEKLTALNICSKEDVETISGIDTESDIKSSLQARIAFSNILTTGKLSEEQIEKTICRITYSEDKVRLKKWVEENLSMISPEDRKYVSSLKFKEFGRLSNKLLNEIEGTDKRTGELNTVIGFLWNTNDNLMEIIASENYTFKEAIEEFNREFYSGKSISLSDRLDDMYVSNAVKRPIIRTLDIMSDIVKANKCAPEKIFVEMARGAKEEQKHNRTKSRRNQILELYSLVETSDIRELRAQLDKKTDNDLQSDKLFLYFTQLGRSMYSGKVIDIEKLGENKLYDIDHIYPQSFVKDDSILNNKVLVLSEENGAKGNVYPIASDIRWKMHSFWEELKNIKLISEEKYKRLVRNTSFTEEEELSFINRQLVETRQSTKVVAELLKEKYPDTKIVYVKAGIVSEFRQDNELLKSRTVNDLHHAKDAYLNVVCGNAYAEKFTRDWFLKTRGSKEYSIKQKTVLGRIIESGDKISWNPNTSYDSVKKNMGKNNIHITVYAFCRHGGFFDQMPVPKGVDLVPRKSDLPTEKYGGYNKASNSYFVLAKYQSGKKSDVMFVPVEYMYALQIESGKLSLTEYIKSRIGKIIGDKVDAVILPIGERKIKINTLISLDGYLVTISGSASKGKQIIVSSLMPLKLEEKWENYIKHLESFVAKCDKNEKIVFDSGFDKISKTENEELYKLLTEKHNSTIYAKRPNPQGETLKKCYDIFVTLNEKQQAIVLLNIVQTFSRFSGGSDFSLMKAPPKAAATILSSNMSNWKKSYSDIRIFDVTTSGIWHKQTENIFDFL